MKAMFTLAAPLVSVLLRAALLIGIMTGPVFALSMMSNSQGQKISGAGLVLYVSLERA
ncbi:MAG: hypothetical protein HC779_06000 [Phyllobacteriaceae bacterium]|nr:hypothetical protein [Phyllobacteriaceae bacterium]